MKINYSFFLLLLLGIVSVSCNDVLSDPTSEEIANKIEGQWSVDESSDLFKSTLQGYVAYIYADEQVKNLIYIEGFYGLGDNVSAEALVNGYSITLTSNQTIGGYTLLSGSGVINKNLKEIIWNYSIDDGSGVADAVVATYTFQY
jgi:hypothetical protein